MGSVSSRRASAKKILVVGFNARPLAWSLHRAGFEVYAADFFGDADLGPLVRDFRAAIDHPRFEEYVAGAVSAGQVLLECAVDLAEMYPGVESVVIGSGLDDDGTIRRHLDRRFTHLGTPAAAVTESRDLGRWEREIEEAGLRVPRTRSLAGNLGAWEAFPAVVKPLQSGGGINAHLAADARALRDVVTGLERTGEDLAGYHLQEFIHGRDMSLTLLFAGQQGDWQRGGVHPVTCNQQLVGRQFLNAPGRFTYCGNVVPAGDQALRQVVPRVLAFARHLPLRGLAGVDFLLAPDGEVVLLEVNPRVPGSLQCSELALDLSLMRLHIAACAGKNAGIPGLARESPAAPVLDRLPPTKFAATKFIYYAPAPIPRFQAEWLGGGTGISPRSSRGPGQGYHDLPRPGQAVQAGHPAFSIHARARSRGASYQRAWNLLQGFFQRWRHDA